MKKGFTILELLVASLLLGMLVTVLTSIFNQSAIAWRTGTAGVADMDAIRDNMAEIREEADNVIIAKRNGSQQVYSLTGLWDDETGELKTRACDVEDNNSKAPVLSSQIQSGSTVSAWKTSQNVLSVGNTGSSDTIKTYTVNVKSAGPDREFDTYDDIWSFPDDFE